MLSLIIFLLVLSVLIVVHEYGHFIAARRLGVKVESFCLGFGPKIFSKKKNDTEYTLNLIPLGGFVKLAGDTLEEYKGQGYEYFSKTPFQRAQIILFGPILNYLLGFLFFWIILFAGYPTLTSKVGGVIDGFGAKQAGVESGDKIIAINDKKIASWEELQKAIYDFKNLDVVRLSILRDNAIKEIKVTIKEKQVDDLLGQKLKVGLLGITPSDEIIKVRHGFFESFILSINKTYGLTVLTYKALWRIITGNMSLKESVTGPLGMFFITSKAASQGLIVLLHLMAVLSISLCIFNLLPLPVLDGGHIVLLVIEKIRGKYLSLKTEQIITKVGFTLIVSLALVITYNDFWRFFGDKITKFFANR